MEFLLVALLGVATGLLVFAVVRSRTQRPAPAPDAVEEQIAALHTEFQRSAQAMQDETNKLSLRLESRLEGIDTRVNRTLTETHNQSQVLVQGIFDKLGEVSIATSSVAEQAKQFSLLQDLLKPPKARGGIGEAMLDQLLSQVLPPKSYKTQHRFKSGSIVDAVVPLSDKLVCIDSKFPLPAYKRMCEATNDAERLDAERAFAGDVAKHITDIATRYIVPDEGTFDFAVMYVPAEGVYGEVLRLSHRGRPLFEMAIERRVIPLSPLTMYGYLQTIGFGLRCLSIEKSAERILDLFDQVQHDVRRFSDEYETLGKHLGNARNKYEDASRKLDRVFDGLARTAELAEDDDQGPPALELVND